MPSDADAADARLDVLEADGWTIEEVERAPTGVVIAGEVPAHATPPGGAWASLKR